MRNKRKKNILRTFLVTEKLLINKFFQITILVSFLKQFLRNFSDDSHNFCSHARIPDRKTRKPFGECGIFYTTVLPHGIDNLKKWSAIFHHLLNCSLMAYLNWYFCPQRHLIQCNHPILSIQRKNEKCPVFLIFFLTSID